MVADGDVDGPAGCMYVCMYVPLYVQWWEASYTPVGAQRRPGMSLAWDHAGCPPTDSCHRAG